MGMDGMQVGMRFETRRGMQKRYQRTRAEQEQADRLGNVKAREGCDRCYCGCKYWENDRCVDCNTSIDTCLNDPEWVKENRT